MKTYRIVAATHHDIFAESLDEALRSFHEMKRQGLLPHVDSVIRVEVEDQKGHYVSVDRPLRAGDLDARKGEHLH
jgi:hypothetical protein